MSKVSTRHNRIPWLDALRGLCVISMILYHLMWDLVYIYNMNFPWYHGTLGYVWQQSICWGFIIISGFSFGLGSHPLRRGIIVTLSGIAITVVTVLFMPEYAIWFGVLTLIGASMIICAILKPILINTPYPIGLLLFGLLFFFTRNVNRGYFGFEKFNIVQVPVDLYANKLTAFLGFPPADFYSTDYFSLFPWFFLFVFGYFLFRLYDSVFHRGGGVKSIPVLWYLGRDALFIYLLHQPLIYGLLYALHRINVI